MALPPSAQRARNVVGDGPVYVSVDVDGFDPAYVLGTGTPEVGGITPREGLSLLRALTGLHIVGADVVEVAPQYDPTTNTVQLAAHLLSKSLRYRGEPPPKQRLNARAGRGAGWYAGSSAAPRAGRSSGRDGSRRRAPAAPSGNCRTR